MRGVSFSVDKGEIVGLLGPNGAGKTTTIKCISSLITPTSGEITIDGVSVQSGPNEALKGTSAVLEGNRNIYWRLTPRENLEFFASLQGINPKNKRGEIRKLLTSLKLEEKMDTPARKLSRGMQQKLALASALVREPQLLLLDEPTLGLDVRASREMRERVKALAEEENITLLLSSHDMDVIEDVCLKVIILKSGRIVVKDRVDNLLDLFRAEEYKVVLGGRLKEEVKASLRRDFSVTMSPDSEELRTGFEVEVAEAKQIYPLLGRLQEEGAQIVSVSRGSPDFEEVFLNLVEGGRDED
ncbi:ABC transporter ATP-binding protein [Candidatus Bipolaricaulota bacterium]|nr:ABC transporter ATP-binding protein [Candidatus Bipolaricaulota bacterium]MBS3792163.1 ABC transporter ATP-binding protein [Candidatus Bipolaricaulota bacterium]